MHDKIVEIVVRGDEVTWRSALFDLVRVEHMDPWNVSLSKLAEHFLALVKTMKEMDLRLSGKMVLAAAILLRLKSEKLLSDDLNEFDQLLASSQQVQDSFFDELGEKVHEKIVTDPREFKLNPKTPQPRKRKVSIYDLVEALEKALEVKRRRVRKHLAELDDEDMKAPDKNIDINKAMDKVLKIVTDHFDKNEHKLMFTALLPNNSRDAKVLMFLPLLHLRNQHKVELSQDSHFADFEVSVKTVKPSPEQE